MLEPAVVTYRTSARLSRRMSEALGAVCSHFAILEWNVDRTIWALTGNDRKRGRHLTKKMLNERRIKRLRLEANNRFGANSASARFYNQLADHIHNLALIRNLYVHGLWSKGKAPGTRRKQFVLSYFTNPNGDAEGVDLPTLKGFVRLVDLTKLALERAAIDHLGEKLP